MIFQNVHAGAFFRSAPRGRPPLSWVGVAGPRPDAARSGVGPMVGEDGSWPASLCSFPQRRRPPARAAGARPSAGHATPPLRASGP